VKPAFIDNKGKPYSFGKISQVWKERRPAMFQDLGQTAVNFFQDRFRAQAWTDRFARRWQPRKANDKNPRRRAILMKSGKLRNSIKLTSYSAQQATVAAAGVPYAQAHNEGFKGTITVKQHTRSFRKKTSVYNVETRRKSRISVNTGSVIVKRHTRKMNLPQRRFMGNSAVLDKRFDKIIDTYFNQATL